MSEFYSYLLQFLLRRCYVCDMDVDDTHFLNLDHHLIETHNTPLEQYLKRLMFVVCGVARVTSDRDFWYQPMDAEQLQGYDLLLERLQDVGECDLETYIALKEVVLKQIDVDEGLCEFEFELPFDFKDTPVPFKKYADYQLSVWGRVSQEFNKLSEFKELEKQRLSRKRRFCEREAVNSPYWGYPEGLTPEKIKCYYGV